MALAFWVNRSQCALFCQVDLTDKLTLAASLRNSNRRRFDGEPVLLPIPPDAPPEIPAILLQSKDGNTSLSVSSARVDVTVNHATEVGQSVRELLVQEGELFRSLAETLSSAEQAQGGISRVGVIVTLNTNLDMSELERVRNRFLIQSFVLGQKRSELRFLDRQMWGQFQVNRWLRLGLSREEDGAGLLEVILDCNTIPEVDYNFDGDGVGKFLELLEHKVDEELKVFDD